MSLLDMIKDSGVIGAGGAGFPTHVKLSSKAEYILLNGAECEPLLRVDQQLMEFFPEEILKGFEEARKLVDAKEGIIGVKGKHKKVIQVLRKKLKELEFEEFIRVNELPDIYPAGDEQVLVYELTKRIVPEGGIPIQVGCVVLNSETALNVYNASLEHPVIYKYLTLAGDIPNPITVKVPVGTPIIDVLKLSGIENFNDFKVIDGGPMMGPLMNDLNGSISKKNKGFIILKNTHSLIRKKSVTMSQAKRINKTSCEQCRMCTDMCPRFLLGHNTQPHKMMRAISYNLDNLEDLKNSYLCCQCNLCELFSCPAGLYPKAANMYFKQKLMEKNIRFNNVQNDFKVRTSRDFRLVPSARLIARLGLKEFDKKAPMKEVTINPDIVKIQRLQHVGAPCIPCVNVGDCVEQGQVIGSIPDKSLGATIHASIAGVITEITDEFIEIRRD